MTEGMMGRGTETRMYNPRSESSHMYRNNHEEDTYSPEDGKARDERYEKKQRKKEQEKRERSKVKHIKIRPSDLPPEEDERVDDSKKIDADRELSAITGPPGNGGFLTSLAMGAKGPGAAGGNMFAMSEAMDNAWSTLLKQMDVERQRKVEARREWRPSTGQFATPPGGSLGPKGATNRRAKAQRRGVKRGKLTGMMDAPKAVEMEHRGVSVKQPMSKDPAKYKEYMGQQEARRRIGNIRNPTASQRRYGQRSYFAGETGGGRLPGVSVSKPRIHAPRMSGKVSMPHLRRPRTPGGGLSGVSRMGLRGGNPGMQAMALSNQQSTPMSFAMSEPMDDAWSTLMKARGLTFSDKAELRALIRQMRRALRRKDTTSKGMGTKDTNGAGEDKPKHRSNSFNNTSRPEGGTEDATNDSRAFGVHPEHRGGPTA